MEKSHNNGKYQRRRKQDRLVTALSAVVVLLLALLAGLGTYLWQSNRAQADFAALAEKTTMPPTQATLPPQTTSATQVTEITEETILPTEAAREILPQYQELYRENPDLWGWLTIPDTAVDYPVMHTPEEPEKYLYADFSGGYSFPGTPFLDAACTETSDNLLIYGHNLMDGTMFRPLLKYNSVTYFRSHPTLRLNTLYEEREYQVMAAFYDRVYYAREDVFKFYQFIDAADAGEFDEAVATIRKKSLYDTGVTAQYGDQLVMLVTCSSHTENGRFVLVARYQDEAANNR